MSEAFPPRRVLWLVAGFTLWSVAFLALYMALTLGCAYGWHERPLIGGLTLQRAVLVVLFVLSLAGAGVLVHQTRDRVRAAGSESATEFARFFYRVVFWVTVAAFASTFATYVPVVALTTCY